MTRIIQQREKEISDEFELFNDWMEKYEYIIELGKELPLVSDKYKTDDFLIEGCQSRVWLNTSIENNIISFHADAEAVITKGMIALLIRLVNKVNPQELISYDFSVLQKIGLQEHLSPTRANGLNGMIKRLKLEALKYC